MLIEPLIYGTIYIIIGLLAGLMAGTLGVGGGIVVVPALAFLFQLKALVPTPIIMQVAEGTSLAVMIFTSLASLGAHSRLGKILWSIFAKLGPGIFIGSVIGAGTAQLMPTSSLKILFALFLLVVAVKMLSSRVATHVPQLPNRSITSLISSLIGFQAGLLGVGGGILIIPLLTYWQVAVRQITAVSNLCTFTVGLAGTSMFIIMGRHAMITTPYALGYVYAPAVVCVAIPSILIAPFAAKLHYLIPIKQLKYIFILLLFLTALTLLF